MTTERKAFRRRLRLPRPGRRTTRFLLLVVVPVLAVGVGGVLYLSGGRFVDTENAYIKADKVLIAPQVAGSVVEVDVHENEPVSAGDVLFRIDPGPYQVALQKAQAQLSAARTQVETLKASYVESQRELASAQEGLGFARREFQRQQRLAKRGAVSDSELDRYRHERAQAADHVATLEQALSRIRASLAGDPDIPVEKHPTVMQAEAARAQARLDLGNATVHAPFDGIVARVPEPGKYLDTGAAAMALVADHRLWVEANLKETTLTHIRPGQRVEIGVDAYPDAVWHGHVASIAQATGSEFSVLPAQNATGNWVKVVQRVPVRIAIDAGPPDRTLRAGLSTQVSIDTGWHPRGPAFLEPVAGWARSMVNTAHAEPVSDAR